MAVRPVSPNRMALLQLKNQLKTARRGHKLLKDKRDELMRRFLILIKETSRLRREAETLLARANREMVLARALMSSETIDTALLSGREDLELQVETENVMSVLTPKFHLPETSAQSLNLPYGLTAVSGELDQAILALKEAFPVLIALASAEKQTELLAQEIEQTRRRVNSLEYRMIPDLEETIHSISLKMDENERGNLTRLMKVKDLILNEKLAKQRQQREQEAHA